MRERAPTGLALKVDAMVEGLHFDARTPAADVGFKAVARPVSDLAACGAEPAWLLLAVSLPDDPARERWVDGLAAGVAEACAAWGPYLVGGDVTGLPPGGPRVVSATVGGPCVAEPHARAGARPGDRLWVTGTLGLAGAGWMLADPPEAALRALRRPSPPLAFGLALARAGLATAAMDLSDGLLADLPRLCRASGVGASVAPDALPADPAIAGRADLLRLQVAGGDDYELLFAAPPAADDAVRAIAARTGTRVTPIGTVTAGSGAQLQGQPWPAPAFSHFPGVA